MYVYVAEYAEQEQIRKSFIEALRLMNEDDEERRQQVQPIEGDDDDDEDDDGDEDDNEEDDEEEEDIDDNKFAPGAPLHEKFSTEGMSHFPLLTSSADVNSVLESFCAA